MTLFFIIVLFIGIVAALGLIYVNCYNRLQNCKIKINSAESVIDEVIRKKYDIIIKIINIIKSKTDIKADYFKEFEDLTEAKISNFDLDRKIISTLNVIDKLNNDYSELLEDKNYKNHFVELKDNEEKLEAAKLYYNKYTTQINEIIKTFPSNLVAIVHKFKVKPYFDGKNLEDKNVNDFKL